MDYHSVTDEEVLIELVDNPRAWYTALYEHPLYPDQLEWAIASEEAIDDCLNRRCRPLTMVCMMSRQAGKNEVSSRLEVRLLMKYAASGGRIIKSAPTARPQLEISKSRLEVALKTPFTERIYKKKEGYIYQVHRAAIAFLSAEPSANRVGETASIVYECDEGQDTLEEVFNRDFRPMCAVKGVPTLMYGTAWDEDNLLEKMREYVREEQSKVGRKLLFETPWWVRAEHNPSYGDYVQAEIDRLGDDHPVILTQYCLKPVGALGKLFSREDLDAMMAGHRRQKGPRDTRLYVAGVDLCGADEDDPEKWIKTVDSRQKRDSTVVTVGELMWRKDRQPVVRVVDMLYLPGMLPLSVAERVFNFCFTKWRCSRVVVDAGGVGDGVAKLLEQRRPSNVVAIKSSSTDVSRMGFNLLAAVKTGRLTMYQNDQSEAWKQFYFQMKECKRELLPSGKMRWYAPELKLLVEGVKSDVHDDFPKSLGYLVEAAETHIYQGYDKEFYESEVPEYKWGAN